MKNYVIFPKRDYRETIKAENAEDALISFATTMDMDMNNYFVAVPEDKAAEYILSLNLETHEQVVKDFMKETLIENFGLKDEVKAQYVSEDAYDIYARGDGETEYECVEKAYDEFESSAVAFFRNVLKDHNITDPEETTPIVDAVFKQYVVTNILGLDLMEEFLMNS